MIKYNGEKIAEYFYNSNGTIQKMTYGNGFSVNYTYTKAILMTDLVIKNSNQSEIYRQTYTYDPKGNITATTLPNPYKTKTTQTRAYQYFSVQRAKFNVQRKTFKKSTLNVARRTLNEYYFTYSPEGNLTSKARYKANASLDTLTGYVYNYQNQLKNVKDFREIVITYGYDPQGQRIYAKTPSGTKFYLWDLGGRIISEGTPTQDYIVRYIYSGNEKIAMIRNDQVYYFINNAQGTPAIIMDSNGKIISRQQMDEYGNLEQGAIGNGAKNEVNFTGKKRDTETGLIYFNQRYYDPELGRFLQEDPMGQNINPYSYGQNNPLTYLDPDGLWSIGFKLFGVGFSIGDGGISVSAIVFKAGVDFHDGSTYGGVGVDVGSNIGGDDSWLGYDLGVSYTHNFSNGGADNVRANAGVNALGASAGVDYNSVNGRIGSYTDYTYDAGDQTENFMNNVVQYANHSAWQDWYFDTYQPMAELNVKYSNLNNEVGSDVKDTTVQDVMSLVIASKSAQYALKAYQVSKRIEIIGPANKNHGERVFQMSYDKRPVFRLDHNNNGWHYHRAPNMNQHRPYQGGF